MELKDVVAVVTGGASGLGEGVVRIVNHSGGKVIIFDLQEEKGKRLEAEFGKENVYFHKCDITKEADVQAGIQQCLSRFSKVNVVVNCAGIVLAKKVLSRKGVHSLEDFQKVIDINLSGSFNVLRLAYEQMVNNAPNSMGEKGVIINTASVAAFDGQIGQAAYSASKAGITGMTLPLAREFAKEGVRVMTIAPGIFKTPMFDVLPESAQVTLAKDVPFPNRLGEPREYAQLVRSILENPMLNGETIRLDGAIRMT